MLRPDSALDVFPVRLVSGEPTEIPAWALPLIVRDLSEPDVYVVLPAKQIPAGKTYVTEVDSTFSYVAKPGVRVSASFGHEFLPDEMITVKISFDEEVFSATYTRPSFAGELPENQDKVYPFYSQAEMLSVIVELGSTGKTSMGNAQFHYMRDKGLVAWHRFDETGPGTGGEIRLTELGEREFKAVPAHLVGSF